MLYAYITILISYDVNFILIENYIIMKKLVRTIIGKKN